MGGGGDAVMKLVSQCLNIVDDSVKFLFMNFLFKLFQLYFEILPS